MLSDLSEYHRINLVDAIRDGSHSPRMLWCLLEALPDTSALGASLRREPRGWGYDRHLLQAVVNVIQINTWVTASATRKMSKPKLLQPPRAQQKRVIRVADLVREGK